VATIKNIAINAVFMPTNGLFSSQIDPEMMLLAISNLLDNALDFSPPGSSITVRLKEVEGQHSIAVQDQGTGVPDYALPRLGERFFTTPRPDHAGDAGQRSGSGLGLAIVQQIMRLHGGQLRLRNTQPGFAAELILPLLLK
jgi:two-component system, OmpR family, sensor histidine kinase CreC